MRLIDAIGLKQSISVSAILEDGKTLEQIIDEQPTIEERKTGRWKLIEKAPGFPDWICSECGGSGRGDYFYCPNCGAKMEVEHETD